MSTIQFKCTLLSDVIVNRKSASEGANGTLDFIPGNNFLGIVAAHYEEFGDDAFAVFHSGLVRFGDAHPIGENGFRTLRAAASIFTPKYSTDAKIYFNYHLIPNPLSDDVKYLQLKQIRSGFFDYSLLPPVKSETQSHYSIKSAFDRETRRSKDKAMFGYEALREGLVLLFEVEAENESLLGKIRDLLIGEKHLGRSRSAQYGLVRIEPIVFQQVCSTNNSILNGLYTVYADGRLVFVDKYGVPSFHPEATDFGFPEGARILWEKSQVRTFQYAPYNGIRKTFDADRCGFEKGSVFVIDSPGGSPAESSYVGCFRNEGFGRVIYNPSFLSVESFYDEPDNKYSSTIQEKVMAPPAETDSPFIKFLKERNNQEVVFSSIYKTVNRWAGENQAAFSGESFASQWGTIRSIAMRDRICGKLKDALFGTRKDAPGYLMHGVAKEKWEVRRRRRLLEDFIDEMTGKAPGYEWLAVINLATVMAKLANK